MDRLIRRKASGTLVAVLALAILPGCNKSARGATGSVRGATETAPPRAPAPSLAAPTLALTPDQVVHANVATAPVEVRAIGSTTLVPGEIAFDQARMAHLTAWVAGRLDDLYVSRVGDPVRPGQVVARIYSPELYADQQDYRSALATWHQVAHSPYPDVADGARQLVEASRQRLLLLGLTSGQIATFKSARQPDLDLTIRSAVGGVVIKKLVQLGQYVKAGDPLFDVVDLSRVWAEAEVPEASIGQVHVGDRAQVHLVAYPGKTFEGRVSLLYPTLDPTTRTVRVRIALDNPGGLLRPQMFATVRLWGPARRQLVVPASAVVDTGLHRWVWVQVAPGEFSPRQVVLGVESRGLYPVVSGLSRGDVAVVSGGFLLDSSARLQGLMPKSSG